MKKFRFIILVSFAILAGTVRSQEPVTFIKFYEDYQNLEEIQYIEKHGNLDGKIANFFAEDAVDIDEKAAVINALANIGNMKNNVETMSMFLGRKYSTPWQNLDYEVLNGDELFCLGYLTIVDNGGDPTKAMDILAKAKTKKTGSYTINMVYALAQAQLAINSNENCNGWKSYNSVVNNSALTKDLSNDALKAIANGMDQYKCN